MQMGNTLRTPPPQHTHTHTHTHFVRETVNQRPIPSVDDTLHSRAMVTGHKSPDTSSGHTEQNHCLRLGAFLQVVQ